RRRLSFGPLLPSGRRSVTVGSSSLRSRFAYLGLGFVLVARVAIVGDGKAAAFEDHAGADADQPSRLALPAVRASLGRRRTHRLKLLPRMSAGITFVVVRRHLLRSLLRRAGPSLGPLGP